MTPEFYLKLLAAIEELREEILEINPTANVQKLDWEINELYSMVNSYDYKDPRDE